jgi:hypothetical protein
MRAIMTKGGFPTWINVRENKFLNEKFCTDELVNKDTFNEREEYLAQTLTSRGVLDKVVNNKEVYYKLNINNFTRK